MNQTRVPSGSTQLNSFSPKAERLGAEGAAMPSARARAARRSAAFPKSGTSMVYSGTAQGSEPAFAT